MLFRPTLKNEEQRATAPAGRLEYRKVCKPPLLRRPARRPTHTVELVSAFRHLQRAADMGKWSERGVGPQRQPARAHGKANQ
eukprot:4564814-Prymnesium_polylepis.1